MEQHYQSTLKALNVLAQTQNDPSRKTSLNHIKSIAAESSGQLDTVTLYSSKTTQERRYIFSLKDVLTLVWTALTDDARFTHHYQGGPDARFQLANHGRLNRLINFFASLHRIEAKKLSHTSVRDELVFLLNDTYKDVHLFKDAYNALIAQLTEIPEFKNSIRNAKRLASVLKALPETKRSAFATVCKDIIQDRKDLLAVLDTLPKSKRLAFAITCKDKIQNGEDLLYVLKVLPEENKQEFTTACEEHIEKSRRTRHFPVMLPDEPPEPMGNFAGNLCFQSQEWASYKKSQKIAAIPPALADSIEKPPVPSSLVMETEPPEPMGDFAGNVCYQSQKIAEKPPVLSSSKTSNSSKSSSRLFRSASTNKTTANNNPHLSNSNFTSLPDHKG